MLFSRGHVNISDIILKSFDPQLTNQVVSLTLT